MFAKPENIDRITLRGLEFTSLCPVTGQPDFCVVEIVYSGNKWCVESKSLKLYLQSFRQRGVFCEALAHEIAETLAKALECSVVCEVKQSARGGIELEALASFVWETDEQRERKEMLDAMKADMQRMMNDVRGKVRERDHVQGEQSEGSTEGQTGEQAELREMVRNHNASMQARARALRLARRFDDAGGAATSEQQATGFAGADEIREATPAELQAWWDKSGWKQVTDELGNTSIKRDPIAKEVSGE